MNLAIKEEMPSIFQTAVLAAEKILKKIGDTPWNEKMLLKSDDFLENEKYQRSLLSKIEFFTFERELTDTIEKLAALFPSQEKEKDSALEITDEEGSALEIMDEKQDTEEMEILFCRKGRKGSLIKIFLEVRKKPYRIPFELHLIPFPEHEIFLKTKTGTIAHTHENFTYHMLPPEEYLTFAFYEIIRELELSKDMSWYQEVYETLCRESVNGRKAWESLDRLLKEHPIPSLEKRLDTLVSYKDYGYMKKRWKSHCKCKKETYPQWEDVIALMIKFLSPIFEGVLKDEIFLGDWMPQLGRYLD